MLYAKVELTDDIQRTIPVRYECNKWYAGTEFFIRQEQPGYGMVVMDGPDQGLGIPPEAAKILATFATYSKMLQAIRASHD